jgi:hypothetical protein
VDMEFTVDIGENNERKPDLRYTLLQCRPQSQLAEGKEVSIPGHLPEQDLIMQTKFMVPQGVIDEIEYVAFVPPAEYFRLNMTERNELARTVGKVNRALKGKRYILVGPGRWGSTNADLGIPVGYSDIFNTNALVELSGRDIGPSPEPSLGTHFFQDLLEAQIYPLAIILDDPQSVFLRSFFYHAPNCLDEFIPADEETKLRLRLMRVNTYRNGHSLRLVMDEEHSTAVGYLVKTSEGDSPRHIS